VPDHGTWIKRRHPSEHRCLLPELNQGLRDKLAAGDQWQCDHCQTTWTVHPTVWRHKPWELRKATEAQPA
jgi:hypothetical protein